MNGIYSVKSDHSAVTVIAPSTMYASLLGKKIMNCWGVKTDHVSLDHYIRAGRETGILKALDNPEIRGVLIESGTKVSKSSDYVNGWIKFTHYITFEVLNPFENLGFRVYPNGEIMKLSNIVVMDTEGNAIPW